VKALSFTRSECVCVFLCVYCASLTPCRITLCLTHTMPYHIVPHSHHAVSHCASLTPCRITFCLTHTMPYHILPHLHHAVSHCASLTPCRITFCLTHTMPYHTVTCGPAGHTLFFPRDPLNGKFFRKTFVEYKMCALIFCKTFFETSLI